MTSVTYVDAADGQSELQAALDAAGVGGVVIANGDFDAHTAATTVNASQTLLGGGTALRVRGATTGVEVDYTTTGAAGRLEGQNGDGVVLASSHSVIGGLTLDNLDNTGIGRGIYASAAQGVSIFGNTISASTNSAITFQDSSDSRIQENTINSNSFGISVISSLNIDISNNDVISSDYSINIHSGSSADISDNYITSNSSAIYVGLNAPSNVTVSGNTLRATGSGTIIRSRNTNTFEPGSTGNIALPGSAPRCSLTAGGTGSIEFTDGNHCSH